MSYAYITYTDVSPDKPLSDYSLRTASNLAGWLTAVRVKLPDGVTLKPHPFILNLHETDLTQPVSQFDPTPVVRVNGRWVKRPDLDIREFESWPGLLWHDYARSDDPRKGYVPWAQLRKSHRWPCHTCF